MGYVGEFGERPWWENPSSGPNAIRRTGEMFVPLVLERRQREHQKRQAEMERALEMLQRYPEVVDRPEGAKLAEQFPELAPIVSVVRNRTRNLGAMEQAGTSWLSGADALQQEHQQSLQRKAMLAMPTSPFGAPNLKAASAALQETQVHPDTFLQRSAERMSPSQRMAAGVWAKERGAPFPEPYFPTLEDLPQNQRALEMAKRGDIDPETARAARISGGLEEGSREKIRRDLEAAKDRRAAVAAEISGRGQDLRERGLDLQAEGLAHRKATAKSGGEKSYKATRGLLTDTLSTYRSRASEQQKAWDAELSTEGKRAEDEAVDNPRAFAQQRVVERLGARPEVPKIPLPGFLNRMARQVATEATSVEEAESIVQMLTESYVKLTTRHGLSPEQAVKVILGEAPEPDLLPKRDTGGL